MKSKKLFIVVVLLFVMALLTGCGTETEEKKKENSNESGVDVTETLEPSYSNVGNYIEYNGNIYYWKLTPSSRDETALFAKYSPIKESKVDLVRMEPDGNEFSVVNTAGNGNIYIANDVIFYQSTEDGENKVYSVDLGGNNKKTYVKGEINYASGNYIYIQSGADIVVLNAKTGEQELIVNSADLIGMAAGNAFYISGDSSKSISINYIKGGENNTNIATFNTSEYKSEYGSDKNITFYGFSCENNKVAIKVGDVQGTGHFVQEGWVIEMDADGQNVTKRIDDDDNEEGAPTLLEATDMPVSYNTEKGLLYKDPDNGSEKVIVDNNKIKSEFGFKTYNDDEEVFIEVYSADKVGDKLYIVIDNGTHYPAGDIGWRYSYKRTKTAAFKYDLGSGKIEKLYEF
ncbi:MAG: hypothetical protein IJH12_05735 [Clostridia bacterium]|nr:hypothetical protein [Clostridia bacterium]